jgi:hypothetical protein
VTPRSGYIGELLKEEVEYNIDKRNNAYTNFQEDY